MTITCKKISASDHNGYQKFVEGQNNAMLYHDVAHIKFLEDLLNCENHTIMERNEQNEINGVLPLLGKSGPLGMVYNSLPFFGSHGGPLAANDEARAALFETFFEIVAQPETALAMFIDTPFQPFEGYKEFIPSNIKTLGDSRTGQITMLPDAEGLTAEQLDEKLMAMIESSTRRNIRKAWKDGVTVSVQNSSFDFLREIHINNIASIGGTVKPDRFFEILPKYFRANTQYRIYVAAIGGKPVAALLLFYYKDMVEYYMPATVSDCRNSQPAAAIIFQAMRDACREGHRRWNWGGTWETQEGVYKFKKKWGATDFPYNYHIFLKNESLLEQKKEILLKHYPYFYTVPFGLLKKAVS